MRVSVAIVLCFVLAWTSAEPAKEHLLNLQSATDGIANPILSGLTTYELVQPVHEGAFATMTESESFPASIGFNLNVYGKDFKIALTKNERLLAPTYAEIRMDYGTVPTGVEVSRYTPESHCFYFGRVEGDSSSDVALSLCSGLRGVVQAHGETFNIEPAVFASSSASSSHRTMAVSSSTGSSRMMPAQHVSKIGKPSFPLQSINSVPHVVYRDQDINGFDASWRCGVRDTVEQEIKAQMAKRVPRAQAASEENIELLAFNDNARFRTKGQAVEHETLSLMNAASSYYRSTQFAKPLHLVLVGQITFTTADPYQKSQGASGIEVEGFSGLLNSFNGYRTNPRSGLPRHDSGQLLSGEMFTSGIRGLAGVGVMCQTGDSSSITQMTSQSMRVNAMIAAHETGHTLSMMHDSQGNGCAAQGFIMAMSTAENTQFSSCSIGYANQFMSSRNPACLDNTVQIQNPDQAERQTSTASADAAESSQTGQPSETGGASAEEDEEEPAAIVSEPSVPIDHVGEPAALSPAQAFMRAYAVAFLIGIAFGGALVGAVALSVRACNDCRRERSKPLIVSPSRSDSTEFVEHGAQMANVPKMAV